MPSGCLRERTPRQFGCVLESVIVRIHLVGKTVLIRVESGKERKCIQESGVVVNLTAVCVCDAAGLRHRTRIRVGATI